MEKFIVLLVMLVCLFGPMAIFTILGNKSLEALGRRPSEGASVMVPYVAKLLGACLISIFLLMVILKFFGTTDIGDAVIRFENFEWKKIN